MKCSFTVLVRVHLMNEQTPLCQICHCYELGIARYLFMTLIYELFALTQTDFLVTRNRLLRSWSWHLSPYCKWCRPLNGVAGHERVPSSIGHLYDSYRCWPASNNLASFRCVYVSTYWTVSQRSGFINFHFSPFFTRVTSDGKQVKNAPMKESIRHLPS